MEDNGKSINLVEEKLEILSDSENMIAGTRKKENCEMSVPYLLELTTNINICVNSILKELENINFFKYTKIGKDIIDDIMDKLPGNITEVEKEKLSDVSYDFQIGKYCKT